MRIGRERGRVDGAALSLPLEFGGVNLGGKDRAVASAATELLAALRKKTRAGGGWAGPASCCTWATDRRESEVGCGPKQRGRRRFYLSYCIF
jgi:hypothetical protein